jgi:ATP-dependent RNA helicase DeaD
MELLQDIPKEELIKKVISVEFNRFLNYYKKSKDLASQTGASSRAEIPSDGTVRYFINIGTRDDYDWMTLKDYLRDTLQVGQDDVFKVDCKEGFSFFNTNAELAEKVMEVLNAVNINGRKINVEISKNEGGRSSGRRDHNGRSGGGRSGGSGFSGRREGGSSGGYRGNSGGGNREGGGYRGNSGGGNREGGFNREGGSGFRPRTSSTGGSDRRSSDSRDSGRRGEGRATEGRSTERRSSGFEGARRTPRRSND